MEVDPIEESLYNKSPGNNNNNTNSNSGGRQQQQQHRKMKSDYDFLSRSETARPAYSSKFVVVDDERKVFIYVILGIGIVVLRARLLYSHYMNISLILLYVVHHIMLFLIA